MYPLLLKPIFKDYLWGGEKLKTIYKKQCDYEKIAESWELACHNEGVSIIQNGEFKGIPLDEYIKQYGKIVLGEKCGEFLPILVKIIDTSKSLSIQVHPNDEYSALNENQQGKIELWYIMDCEDNAELFYGLKNDMTRKDFLHNIEKDTIMEVLNHVSVKKGDVFVIDYGIIHAIGKNMTVAEIGTNCNVTYRIYDFNRIDANGKKRELNIKKAADVAILKKQIAIKEDICDFDCKAFNVHVIHVNGAIKQCADKISFHNILCTEGKGEICCTKGNFEIKQGDSYFIPANTGNYIINGKLTVLKTTV